MGHAGEYSEPLLHTAGLTGSDANLRVAPTRPQLFFAFSCPTDW